MADLGVRFVVGGDADIVRLMGDLDIAAVPDMRAVLHAIEPHVHVVVDLGAATLVSAAAIATLVREVERRTFAGGSLVVRNASPLCRRCLGVTGTTWLLGDDVPSRRWPTDTTPSRH